MDGLDAASRAIKMGVTTPIIALTANIMSNDLELYKENGMSDYLGKPFKTQELWKCLIKYLPVDSYTSVDKKLQSAEEEKMLKLLKLNFVKNNQTLFHDLTTALEADDIKKAHRLVHTLKGNAGQIGEKRLQAAAAKAEGNLSGGANLLCEEQIHNLKSELEAVLELLAPLMNEQKSYETAEAVDITRILELLDKLEPLLESKDTECLSFIDDLYGVAGAGELVNQIERYRFKPALETLENLRKELKSEHE
jgi:HPt (histidine-containing phosphotransfer) domain-containing protein